MPSALLPEEKRVTWVQKVPLVRQEMLSVKKKKQKKTLSSASEVLPSTPGPIFAQPDMKAHPRKTKTSVEVRYGNMCS